MGIKDFFTNGASKIVSDGTTNVRFSFSSSILRLWSAPTCLSPVFRSTHPPSRSTLANSIEPASPHSSSDEKLDLEKDGAHVIDKQAVYGPDLKYDDGLVREVDEVS